MKIVIPVSGRANNDSQNKNIGNNGDESANHSQISEKQLHDEFSGILSIN
jgi:hypothetical protein